MIKKIPKALFYIMTAMLFIILFFVMLNVTADIRKVIFRSLRPVLYGAVIAYLLKPMCNFFEKRLSPVLGKKLKDDKGKKLSHYLSMLFTYIIFGAIICFLLSIILPQLVESIMQLVSSIPAFYNSLILFVKKIVDGNPLIAENIEHILDGFYQAFNSWYQGSLFPLLSQITGGVMLTFTFILNIFIGIIVSVYLLNGRKKLCAQAKLLIKSVFPRRHANAIFSEAEYADKMFSGYFAGTLIDSALVAVICYLLCLITNMPFALLVSVIVGVANIIPFFGPYIGMIPSAVIILTVSPVKALIFAAMVWVLQQIDGNIIAPKIIGSSVGLSSFWVLFAILLFGGLYGFFGMIIGSPIFAVIYHVVGKLIRKHAKIKGEQDFVKNYEKEFPSLPKRESLRYRFKRKEDKECSEGDVEKNSSEGGAEERGLKVNSSEGGAEGSSLKVHNSEGGAEERGLKVNSSEGGAEGSDLKVNSSEGGAEESGLKVNNSDSGANEGGSEKTVNKFSREKGEKADVPTSNNV